MMDVLICVIVMLTGTVVCLVADWPIFLSLFLGVILVSLAAIRRGFTCKEIAAMAWKEEKKAVIVLEILLIVGAMTSLWRSGGTIPLVIYYGVQIIRPRIFLLVAFLLTSLISYMMGTSFGVTGTVGLILITMARTGGVNVPITAGVLMSAAYLGDRGAPTSSAAYFVATVTQTDFYRNLKQMRRAQYIPFFITVVAYAVLSYFNPMHEIDSSILTSMTEMYKLNFFVLVPALVMLILPMMKIPVHICMLASAVTGILVSVFVQKIALLEVLKIMVLGYTPTNENLVHIMSGGGIVSMLTSIAIILATGLFLGLMRGIGGLDRVEMLVEKICKKTGRFFATCLTATIVASLFCNQTVTIAMTTELVKKQYGEDDERRHELALDLGNSAILIPALIPWVIACSVPLSMLSSGIEALPFAFLIYLTPICYAFTKKLFVKK